MVFWDATGKCNSRHKIPYNFFKLDSFKVKIFVNNREVEEDWLKISQKYKELKKNLCPKNLACLQQQ